MYTIPQQIDRASASFGKKETQMIVGPQPHVQIVMRFALGLQYKRDRNSLFYFILFNSRVVVPALRHLSASERLSCYTLTYKTLATSQSSYLYNLLQVYTRHHGLSVLQPRNFSRCHTYPLTLVGAPSATALLQHGIQFRVPLKIILSHTISGTTSSLTS